MDDGKIHFSLPITGQLKYLGLGSGTNINPARSTSTAQHLDRSHNPNADTHTQVMTPNVPHYTACAPRSLPNGV